MTIENEELNDDQLFNDAVGDEPEVPETPAAEVIEQPETPVAEVVAEKPTEGEKPAVDDNAPLVPSWRLREINEEKRTLAEKVAALEAEKSRWQQPKPAEPTKEEKEAAKAAKPDPLLDPEGYEAYLEAKVEAKFLNDRRETSLQRAADAHPEEFKEAYAAAQKAVDPALRARMQASNDPGKTLLSWHREEKVKAEVGNDPAAYKQRLRDEALKDPEFRKAAMEAWRAEAPTQTNGRPNIQLAPSMSGVSRASAALRSANDDVSDAELFDLTTG